MRLPWPESGKQEWKALRDTDISAASATEQRRRLEGTELWYHSTGEIVGVDLDPDEPSAATEHTSAIEGISILHRLPTITVKLQLLQ